jgi:hypothetical protein
VDIDPLDVPISGAKAIGQKLGLTERRAFILLEQRELPATKLGKFWTTTMRRLLARINADLPLPEAKPEPPPHVPKSRKRRLQPRRKAA